MAARPLHRRSTHAFSGMTPSSLTAARIHRCSTSPISLSKFPRSTRTFASSRCFQQQQHQQNHRTESFRYRLRAALKNTKVEWKPIPIGLGIGFLGLLQFYKVSAREKRLIEEEEAALNGDDDGTRPKKRPRIRPSGPWCDNLRRRHIAMLTDHLLPQASPDHVHFAIEGPIAIMGPFQRTRYSLLPPCSRLQTLLLHIRR